MGAEFQQKTKKTIIKHLDAKRVALAFQDLLTSIPADQPRSFLASIEGRCEVTAGATMIAEADGNAIRLRQGNSFVARLDDPPAELVARVTSAGIAGVTVDCVHSLSKKLEVTLC